ncbi:immune inhibitor A domain-containing protein [Promethearchaeum syntrophicum]|uniref:Immune inhibitor A domain-containing protein n=1 Tax=Promethearchaeum syntrophicum TaxID=2594042 RepID=A0A5B9D9G8_9ARCH|nr:immune inhibitor A domain-containing protein [Candidatus Prometheoarchaeum syntrophicum]QEE15236.1 Immune inhibitor A peptidase M6 [Candidatus Prometheoarchaeum syntrophicum]
MKKINSVLLILMMAFGALSIAFIPSSTGSVYTELPDYEPLDFGTEIRNAHYEIHPDLPSMSAISSSGPRSAGVVEDIKYFLTLDSYNGFYFFDAYECRAVGDISEVWVQVDLSFPDDRETPIITTEQVEYLLDEFENNIYEKDTEVFGTPDFHDGSNSLLSAWGNVPPNYYYEEFGKNLIMVSNVRDEAYYTPGYPYYIAGFYSPSFEAYNDRNMITIDSHDWENRMGEDADRPFLYESIIAHEYQHLIHDDYNPLDETFMNEACSLYAEPLCGYPIGWGQVLRFLETPDNSLTVWGDQGDINILADYGSSFLWAMYLTDHYTVGEENFLGHFVQSRIPGVDGINAALEYFGHEEDFDDVYHDWRIANLIDAESGKYGYTTFDLADAEYPLYINDMDNQLFKWTQGTDFGTTITYDDYDTYVSMLGPYGTDYIGYSEENWNKNFAKLYFDGDDTAIVYGWEMIDGVWYSGADDLMNTLIAAEIYVDPLDPTLYMTSYWDIEDYWDFGFVQVSEDDGETWTSLENEYTTSDHDPGAHQNVLDNLPGITEYVGEVVDMTFDLSLYAGENVQIGFRYVTDWATFYEGWYIFDANVGGVSLDLAIVYPDASYMVTVVAYKETGGGTHYMVMDLDLNDGNFGSISLLGNWADHMVLIVSATQPQGFSDYSFRIKPGKGTRWMM